LSIKEGGIGSRFFFWSFWCLSCFFILWPGIGFSGESYVAAVFESTAPGLGPWNVATEKSDAILTIDPLNLDSVLLILFGNY
jgi:hypothetical protein